MISTESYGDRDQLSDRGEQTEDGLMVSQSSEDKAKLRYTTRNGWDPMIDYERRQFRSKPMSKKKEKLVRKYGEQIGIVHRSFYSFKRIEDFDFVEKQK
jgi:hypothetical protein